MITTNPNASDPATVKIAGKPSPAEKNTTPDGAVKSGMFGTLIFSHSVAESDISPAERSVSDDSGSLSAYDERPGDSNV